MVEGLINREFFATMLQVSRSVKESDAIIGHRKELIGKHHKNKSRSYIDVLTDHTGDPGHVKVKVVISAKEVVGKDKVSLLFHKKKVVACVEALFT